MEGARRNRAAIASARASAARSSTSSPAPSSRGPWRVGVTPPGGCPLRRRISSGERPHASGIRFRCIFGCELGLRRAEATERAVWRRVGGHGPGTDGGVRAVAGPTAWIAPRDRTADVIVRYAPPFATQTG